MFKYLIIFLFLPLWILAQSATKVVYIPTGSTWVNYDTVRTVITTYYQNSCGTCTKQIVDQDFEQHILNGTAYVHYVIGATVARSWHYQTNIVFDGNSITAGARSTNGYSYPMQMQGMFLDSTGINPVIINHGVAGQRLYDMNADAATDIDGLYDATHHILVLMGGINDFIGSNPKSVNYVFNIMKTYVANRRAIGWKVYVCTITPTNVGNDPDYNLVHRIDYNNRIRDSLVCDGKIDVGANDVLGCELCYNNTTYYDVDRLHPVNEGYRILAGMVYAIIKNQVILNKY